MRSLDVRCAYMRISIPYYSTDTYVLLVGDVSDVDEYIAHGSNMEYRIKGHNKKIKVSFDGDSITFGTAQAPSSYPTYKDSRNGYSYADIVCHQYGWDLYKFALAMSPLAYNADGTQYERTPLVDRFTKIPKDSDFIYIGIGSNDWAYSQIALGEYGDTEKTTFYGALDFLCKGLKEHYPTTMVMFGTIIKRYREGAPFDNEKGYPNAAGEYIQDYNDAIKKVCGFYGYPVCDMYEKSGVNAWLEGDRSIMVEDGIHPNILGQSLMAKVCANALKGYDL